MFTLTSPTFAQETTSKVHHYEYQSSTDGITWSEWTAFTVAGTYIHNTNTAKGGVRYQFRAVNEAGTVGDASDAVIVKRSKLDQTAVDQTKYTAKDLSLSGEKGADPWYIGNVTVTVTKQNTVGVNGLKADTKYQLYTDANNKGDVKDLTGTTILVNSDGAWTLDIWTEDEAGNKTTPYTITIKLDKTNPTISEPVNNPAEWKNTAQTITFTAEDATSDVKTVEVTCGDSKAVEHTDSSFIADRNGKYTIKVTDNAGRTFTKDVQVAKVDLMKPVIHSITPNIEADNWYGATEFTVSAEDLNTVAPISDIASILVSGGKLENVNITADSKFTTADEEVAQEYTYTVTVTDNAGNVVTDTVTVKIDTRIDTFLEKMTGKSESSDFTALAEVKDWYDNQSKLVQSHIQANPAAKEKYDALLGWIDAKGADALSDLTQKIQNATTIDEIRTAEKIYNSLPEAVQKQVTPADKSTLDKMTADADRAQQVIDALVEANKADAGYQSKKGTVQAYETLTDEQKALIPADKKTACDTIKTNVKAVDDALKALEAAQQKPLTPEKIAAAKQAYDLLDTDQKKMFPADAKEHLDATTEASTSAGTVGTTIGGLGEASTEEDILNAKKAYDALSEEEKQLVSPADKAKLDAAYNELIAGKEAADRKAIQDAVDFTAQVEEVKKNPTVEKINALEKAYETLSAEAKGKVDSSVISGPNGYDQLIDNRDAAEAVIEQLKSVTTENLNSAESKEATKQYQDNLTPEQKKLVDQATQNKNQDILDTRDTLEKIGDIPAAAPDPLAPEYEDYKAKVDAAKQAYDQLPDGGRKLVSTEALNKLNEAYDTMIEQVLKYQNRDTTHTTDVEISGLTQVPVPKDAATAPKTVVRVEAEDSETPFAPQRPNKNTVLSVDVTLVAYLLDENNDEISREEIQPDAAKPVTVKLRLPAGYDLDTLEVWHITDNGISALIPRGQMTMVTESDGIYAVFSVKHFSHFVFLAEQLPDSGSGGSIRYPVVLEQSKNGTVQASPARPRHTEWVILTPKPEHGYVVDTIAVTDQNGNAVPVVRRADGTYTFRQPEGTVTVRATFRRNEEPLSPDKTGVSALLNTKDHSAYMQGYKDGRFGPKDPLTRAQAAQMFYNLLLEQKVPTDAAFADVSANAWYAKAVNTMAALGIMDGVGGNRFDPNRPISRAEFTVTAMRFATLKAESSARFSDVSETAWYADGVCRAAAFGWITGYPDGTFKPQGTISRAEVVTIVNRMLGRVPDQAWIDSHAQELTQFPDLSRDWAYYAIMEAANSHTHSMKNGTEQWTGLQKK